MKQLLSDVLEFFSFLLLMMILGFGTIIYSVFAVFHWGYTKLK